MAFQRGVVRWPFRVVGGILGAVIIAMGLAASAWSVWVIGTMGWRAWWRDYHEIAAVYITGLGLGIAFVRAALTGRDPYVTDGEDRIDESESEPPSA